uniref:Uncharacterized protein n=1 Tax=Solanum tuberosum TaxID=4113 RepID=M1D2L6_SOLTU
MATPTMRFSTEVAQPKFTPVVKSPPPKRNLDTIIEEEAYVSIIVSSLDRTLEQKRYHISSLST